MCMPVHYIQPSTWHEVHSGVHDPSFWGEIVLKHEIHPIENTGIFALGVTVPLNTIKLIPSISIHRYEVVNGRPLALRISRKFKGGFPHNQESFSARLSFCQDARLLGFPHNIPPNSHWQCFLFVKSLTVYPSIDLGLWCSISLGRENPTIVVILISYPIYPSPVIATVDTNRPSPMCITNRNHRIKVIIIITYIDDCSICIIGYTITDCMIKDSCIMYPNCNDCNGAVVYTWYIPYTYYNQ